MTEKSVILHEDPEVSPKVNNGLQRNGYVTVQVRRFKDYHKTTDDKLYSDWLGIVKMKKNLLTNAGRDEFHNLCYLNDDTDSPGRGFGWIALTETNITPAVADTTLSGEITAITGLQRTDALTKTHTSATNSSTTEHTFTAGAVFTTVRGTALFNLGTAGIMSHEATFTSTALALNDQLKVTYTLNLG